MRNLSWNSEKPSSRLELFCYKDVLENFAKLIGKRLYLSICFNRVADWRTPTLSKRLGGLPVKFAKLSRILLLQKTYGLLLLKMTQKNLWHFEEILCKMLQTQALYIIFREVYPCYSSYIFAESSAKSHCFTQSECYLAGFHIFLR